MIIDIVRVNSDSEEEINENDSPYAPVQFLAKSKTSFCIV